MRTRVKICGITRAADGEAAAQAGADAIGLVFYSKSPRCVDLSRAQEICRALPPFVSAVALFVDAQREWVEEVLSAVPVDVLQFHGSEDATQCTGFGRPYIKAVGMQPGLELQAVMQSHPEACGFLLDAWQPDIHGGSGVAFDWAQAPAPAGIATPLILAGGLTADTVAEAVIRTRPFAVNVSSGVELEKGIKSAEKMQAFIRGVERGDASKANR